MNKQLLPIIEEKLFKFSLKENSMYLFNQERLKTFFEGVLAKTGSSSDSEQNKQTV